jgi:hypothetical protein
MRSLEPQFGRQALDFVDAIEAWKTTAIVIPRFQRMIGNPGLSRLHHGVDTGRRHQHCR